MADISTAVGETTHDTEKCSRFSLTPSPVQKGEPSVHRQTMEKKVLGQTARGTPQTSCMPRSASAKTSRFHGLLFLEDIATSEGDTTCQGEGRSIHWSKTSYPQSQAQTRLVEEPDEESEKVPGEAEEGAEQSQYR